MTSQEPDKLLKRLEREQLARKEAEALLEKKSRELYQAYKALSNAHSDLEKRVIERTQELQTANEKLAAARDQALEVSRLKSEFLANMSHEIRTPMNAILGMTGFLLDSTLIDEQRDFAESIKRSGETLLCLINDILDFSKIEAGKLDLEHEPFELQECIDDAMDLISHQAFEKGLELLCNVANDIPDFVVGDIIRLRQILVNLLSNAVKFTEKGEIVLSVELLPENLRNLSVRTKSSSAIYLKFRIKDTGIGISKINMQKLFEMFSQVDTSTTRKYGGTGLGLTISKRLVELMDGEITVESELGKGSTFSFTIKTQRSDKALDVPYKSGIQPHLLGKRVLLVDDNTTNLRILSRQVEGWGMTPCPVSSATAALALVNTGERFNLGIIDMQMPDIDGFMLAKELKRLPVAKTTPLIMLSSVGNQRHEDAANLFNAYLAKPVKTKRLNEVINRIFNKTQTATFTIDEANITNVLLGDKHPLRILLAEDHPINQKVALHMLRKLGYTADIANNGREALNACLQKTYDVVLMDVQMPEMDGVQATKAIRDNLPKPSQPRIIAVTAHALTGDREHYIASGMDAYLSKPIEGEELSKELEISPVVKNMDRPTMKASSKKSSPSVKKNPPAKKVISSPKKFTAININVLKERLGDDAMSVIEDIGPMFLEMVPQALTDLANAFSKKDAETLYKLAHGLKTTSASIGATDFSVLCLAIEQAGRKSELTNTTKKLVQDLKKHFLGLSKELKQLLQDNSF